MSSSAFHQPPPRGGAGFSLVELLVAMTLGLVAIAGLGQLYVGGRDAQRIVDANASLTEKARFALEFLARDIRMAGYFTCGGQRAAIANALNDGVYWFDIRGIDGVDGGDGSQPVTGLPAVFAGPPNPLPGSDLLVLRYADTKQLIPIGADDLVPDQQRFDFASSHPFGIGDIAVVNDAACTQTAIFQVTGLPDSAPKSISYSAAAAATPGNCTNNLAGDYTCTDLAPSRGLTGGEYRGGNIAPLVARAFFVANLPAQQCQQPAGGCAVLNDCPALFIAGTDGNGAVAVLHDVSAMQIDYGLDDDELPGVDRYVTANELTSDADWSQVRSVRTTLNMVRADCRVVAFAGIVALRNPPLLTAPD